MDQKSFSPPELQSVTMEKFLYHFVGMRKGEIRRTVQVLQSRYPHENPEQLARRLIDAKAKLALISGTLLHLPMLLPGIGQVLKLAGMVGSIWIGVFVAILLHAFNILLGIFAPTIHSLRLHYVEFFSKFMEPGGKEFKPLGKE